MKRKVDAVLERFYENKEKKALLVTGARQVGKTYSIQRLAKHYPHSVYINFIENPAAVRLFSGELNASAILLRLSALSGQDMVPGETLIILDEVQECREMVTAVKFLVDEGSYQYILSGSLLGVELKDIRSVPVGYMDVIQMYPMDFEEFLTANSVSDKIFTALKDSFLNKTPVEPLVHEKLMELFRLYLVVGGMPAVVQCYLKTYNLSEVLKEQQAIITLYKKDIAKYDANEKLALEDIFELIPSELNSKNKRFILKELNEHKRFDAYKNSFLWLKEAGVALPTYCVSEPIVPLLLSKSTNLFKLFLSDVGLLAAMYMGDIQMDILTQKKDINFGAVYENAAAQELTAHGFRLYYFNSKKQGELDFILEQNAEVIPIEIKSGKDYQKHAALSSVLASEAYGIKNAFVFYNGNVCTKDKITYYPIYMLMFVQKTKLPDKMLYKPDISVLTDA